MNGNDNMSTKLPVFDGKNWNRWMIQMRVLFGAQDVLELVTDGYIQVTKDAIEEERERGTEKQEEERSKGVVLHPLVCGCECV